MQPPFPCFTHVNQLGLKYSTIVRIKVLFPQVPLGVYLKNENRIDEMIDILKQLQGYIPCVKKSVEIPIQDLDVVETVNADVLHAILFGGDQLTRRSLVRFQPEPGFFSNSDGIGQYMWPRFLSAVIKKMIIGVWNGTPQAPLNLLCIYLRTISRDPVGQLRNPSASLVDLHSLK